MWIAVREIGLFRAFFVLDAVRTLTSLEDLFQGLAVLEAVQLYSSNQYLSLEQ